jgi:molybdenum cofactor synthesis domain-containing protein
MNEEKIVRAAMIVIGSEILSGRTQDTNLNTLARGLNDVGIVLCEARIVSDDEAAIVAAVNELRARHDYVFTTGGIGPTHDDITAQCVANAFGVPLILNQAARALLAAHYDKTGRELNAARLRMAHMPQGASLIANPISTAPGFRIENVFVLAGVPVVMQAMLEGLKPGLVGGRRVLSRSVGSLVGEGIMARGLAALQDKYPALEIGSYPFYRPGGVSGTNIVIRHVDAAMIDAALGEAAELIRSHGGEPEFGDG